MERGIVVDMIAVRYVMEVAVESDVTVARAIMRWYCLFSTNLVRGELEECD